MPDVGEGLLEIAAEDERAAVEMRLAELVRRRDVGDTIGEPEIMEPGCLRNVEVIDGSGLAVLAGRLGCSSELFISVLCPTLTLAKFGINHFSIGSCR